MSDLKNGVNMEDAIVEKYDATAPSYDELYRYEQYRKYGTLIQLVGANTRSATILDAGCGTGLLIEYLSQSHLDDYSRYICLDPSIGMLSRLIVKEIDHRVIPVLGYAEETPLRDSSIDITVSITVWGNIVDHEKAILEFTRVTRDNGLIIVTSHEKHQVTPPSEVHPCFKIVARDIDVFYLCRNVKHLRE